MRNLFLENKEKKDISKIVEDLKKSNKQKDLILNNMEELVVLLDLERKILWGNKTAYSVSECLKSEPVEIKGKYCREIFTEDNEFCEDCPVEKARETGKMAAQEMIKPNNRIYLKRAYPIKDEKGNLTNFLEVVGDITEKKKMEEALRDSEKLYKTLINISPYAVTVSDLKGEITYASGKTLRMHGYDSAEELLGKSAFSLIDPSDQEKASKNLNKTLNEGSVKELEFKLLRKDGSSFIGELNASLLKNEEDNPQAFVATTRDITKRKETEKKLKEKEAYNFALFNYSPVETVVVDREGKVIKSNLAKRRSGDRVPQIGDVMYKDYGSKHEIDMYQELMNCIKAGENKEFPRMEYAGKFLSINIAPFSEGAIIISQDITERVKAEKALRENEQRFHLIEETIPSLLVITDREGRNIYVSQNCKEITGYSCEELEGKFIWWVHEDDRGKAGKVFERAFKEHMHGRNFEYKAIKKDGKIWYASSSWEPIFNDKEEFQGMVLQTIDVSNKKIMEQEIAKAQKLESIGILAGGIAHDFNNFLTGIIGNISLAKLKMEPENEVYEILTESEKAAQSAKSLTQQLLTFSKGGVPIKEKADIKDLLRESANFVLVGSNVKCDFDFEENLWDVVVDKGQMNQVVNNIVLNALEAMPQGGAIVIKTENVDLSGRRGVPFKKGRYVKITIRDTGVGISGDYVSKIFDPFFTTKQKGSGLGLATVFSIIKKHKGYVYVESELGEGTSFYIYLPASTEKKKESQEKEREENISKDKGKVLIMDDKSFIRKAAQRALDLFGYEVQGAEDGEEAINIYRDARDRGTPFDVVILDLTVPGAMGGLRTLQELRKIDPKVKAIVSSGYSDDPVMSDHLKYGFNAIIKKPYEYHELAEAVKKLIEEK
jgi:PAS domain S-box-containing protein